MPPVIIISGYYGFKNSGDEAMLCAIINALREKIPGVEIVVLSHRPAETAAEFGVRAVSRWNPFRLWRELGAADLLLSGGGSLLQDVTGPFSILYYLGVIYLARLRGRKVCLYGQGVGPLRYLHSRWLTRRIVSRVDLVTLRDPASRQELEGLGVKAPIYVTADPVLGVSTTPGDLARGREILARAGGGGQPALGISLRPWAGAPRLVEVFAALGDRLSRAGWDIVFVPMQGAADLAVIRQVTAKMREKSIVLDRVGGFRDLMAVAGCFAVAVGMRLHFLVFAALAGVPVIGLGYDPKVNRFLEQVGMGPAEDLAGVAPERLEARVREFAAQGEALREKLRVRVTALREEAVAGAAMVAALLQGKSFSGRDKEQGGES
ncbi:MAG: polysaccharide pyruvyl transferase CsaB [Bacillota bacterium]